MGETNSRSTRCKLVTGAHSNRIAYYKTPTGKDDATLGLYVIYFISGKYIHTFTFRDLPRTLPASFAN